METTKTQSVKGFKGFDKKLKCRDYQYEIGKTFTHEGEVKACSSGFHFCENPLDVLYYYNTGSSRFCEVEGCGEVSKDGEDSKVAVSELHIKAEITLGDLVKTGIKFVFDKIKYKDADKATSGYMSTAATSGDESTAATSGNMSTAATSGNRSTAATSGNRSTAATSGKRSTAATSGYMSTAATSGDGSTAATSGIRSTAATSGYRSTAATSGNESTAATSGNESTAATSGNRSTAATSGYMSTAATSGDGSTAATSGYMSTAATSGNESTAATSGNESTAVVEGDNSVAVSTGRDGMAKGSKGCWLVLAERDDYGTILSLQSFKVDGEKVKANTLYTLKNGKLKEVL